MLERTRDPGDEEVGMRLEVKESNFVFDSERGVNIMRYSWCTGLKLRSVPSEKIIPAYSSQA
jgi:hypothetical protein